MLIANINSVNYLLFQVKEETDSDLQLLFPPTPFHYRGGFE